MTQNDFDVQFQNLTKQMVEIAFEFLDFNKTEVDCVYVFCSSEDNRLSYNMFYKINGYVVHSHNVNSVSQTRFDLSDDRESALLRLGNKSLREICTLFLNFKRDVPTLIKIFFNPKSGKFDCKLIYELQYSYDENRSYVNVFNEWFEEEKMGSKG